MLKQAGEYGVSKINVDTDLRLAMTAQIRKVFNEDPSVFDPRKYLGAARDEIKNGSVYFASESATLTSSSTPANFPSSASTTTALQMLLRKLNHQ